MQFLVYIVLLAVSLSTVLLELHWLTSPGTPSRPAITASAPPPAVKAEGPNVELSPVYPKPEPPRSVGSVTGAPEAVARAEASAPEPSAKAPSEPAVSAPDKAEPADKPEPAQRAVTETTGSAPPSEAAPQPSPSPPRATNVVAKSQCDVAACTAAFSSFRAADCTYQPIEGARQLCVKPPAAAQRSASREPITETVHNKQSKPSGIERDKQAEIERAVQFLRGRKAADEADRSNEASDEPRGLFATDRRGW